MNDDLLEGKWTEVKGRLRESYGDLTDDEIEEAKGNREQLVGILQQKLGSAKQDAERELDRILNSI